MVGWAFKSVPAIPVPVCFIPLLCCSRKGGPQPLQSCKVEVRAPASQGLAGFLRQRERSDGSPTVATGKESTCSDDQAFAQGNSAGLSLQAPCSFLCLFILSLGFSFVSVSQQTGKWQRPYLTSVASCIRAQNCGPVARWALCSCPSPCPHLLPFSPSQG